MKVLTLEVYAVAERLPDIGAHVLAFHDRGVDRGARYGAVWRLAEACEDELRNVTHWAEAPELEEVRT